MLTYFSPFTIINYVKIFSDDNIYIYRSGRHFYPKWLTLQPYTLSIDYVWFHLLSYRQKLLVARKKKSPHATPVPLYAIMAMLCVFIGEPQLLLVMVSFLEANFLSVIPFVLVLTDSKLTIPLTAIPDQRKKLQTASQLQQWKEHYLKFL